MSKYSRKKLTVFWRRCRKTTTLARLVGWTPPSWPRNTFPRYSPQIWLGYVCQQTLSKKYFAWVVGQHFISRSFTFNLVSVGEAFGERALPTIPDRLWHVWLLSPTLYQPRKNSHKSTKSTLKCPTANPLNWDPFTFKMEKSWFARTT